MSFNVEDAVEIPLEIFGGLVTEIAPTTVPMGASPDNQDVVFQPGAVSARFAFHRLFTIPFGSLNSPPTFPTVLYAKSYVDPTGIIRNLYLDSDGVLHVEIVNGSPTTAGTYSTLAALTSKSYCKSVTAFGREYISLSDGLHGTDIPLQFDGTNLDRVTQDGPGSPPSIGNLPLPEVSMLAPSPAGPLTIIDIFPYGLDPTGTYYTLLQIIVSSGASAVLPGNIVVVMGSVGGAPMSLNGTFQVAYTGDDRIIYCYAYIPAPQTFSIGGTCTVQNAYTMVRANNIVTVNTDTPHGLQVGYRAQISGQQTSPFTPFPALGVGEVSGGGAIVIDNQADPGIATVNVLAPHGLASGNVVIIDQVIPVTVGTNIVSQDRQGQVVTTVTADPHGLSAGVAVNIVGPGDGTFAGTFNVVTIVDQQTFTYIQADSDGSSVGGTVTLNWPLPNTGTPNTFEVLSIPSPTSFTVAFDYADAVFTSGAVWFPWTGTFFVKSVPSPTSFTYLQYGPDGNTAFEGTVTPVGQVAPGIHQMQVFFITRQGYTTAPSPPLRFNANGGQYLAVSNIPIGPSNVIARALAFTGVDGAYFFYIPASPQVNGQIVGTATQINDNTTTSIVLDFSDNTLFAALGINVPGNNLPAEIVIDGALGFGYYGNRLLTYGQRNRVQNFLNLMFDGGYQFVGSPAVNQPTGWLPLMNGSPVVDSPGGVLVTTGRWGGAWQFSGAGYIYQSAFEDAYGAPILEGNTQYTARAWVKGTGTATLTLTGGSPATTLTANLAATAAGGWVQADFSGKTPVEIPADFILKLSGTSGVIIDEISIIFTASPYLDRIIYGSYVDNPEGFDGVTGPFGPSDDTRKIMDFGILRESLIIVTQEPSGRIHETNDNGTTEPSGWTINEVGANCGALSAFSLTKSQADDASAGGGEEWMSWASSSGARIFSGSQPWKISQEIQPDWGNINPVAQLGIWSMNDPTARVIYFGLPTGKAGSTSLIYPVNYRELDTAEQIYASPQVKVGFGGRLIATDNVRKWTRWNATMNGAALMYRASGILTPIFFGGNAQAIGTGIGTGNVYYLDPCQFVDSDYGPFFPYYTTFFFVNHGQEEALQLGAHRKQLQWGSHFASGIGFLKITILVDALYNPWPINFTRLLTAQPRFDIEWPGGNAVGQRMAIRIDWEQF